MVLRIPRAIVLLVGLAGCEVTRIDAAVGCLKEHPGNVGCCPPGGHVDNGTCCPAGSHALTDIEHPDWKVCVFDEDPCTDAGACLNAGADAEADAGADAP